MVRNGNLQICILSTQHGVERRCAQQMFTKRVNAIPNTSTPQIDLRSVIVPIPLRVVRATSSGYNSNKGQVIKNSSCQNVESLAWMEKKKSLIFQLGDSFVWTRDHP